MTSSQLYRPSSLSLRKGKWYVSVTKPKELQFCRDRQARRSTGTSDRKQAALLQHQLTQEIYDSFDEALGQTDKFFEAVRPELEAQGFRAKDWYELGYVQRTEINADGVRVHKKLSSQVEILRHLYIVDDDLLDLLHEEERREVLELATPKPLTPEETFEFARMEDSYPLLLQLVTAQRSKRGDIVLR